MFKEMDELYSNFTKSAEKFIDSIKNLQDQTLRDLKSVEKSDMEYIIENQPEIKKILKDGVSQKGESKC